MKRSFTTIFLLLTVLFCVFLILANLLEVKVVKVGWFTFTAGLLVFPFSYIINDCIVEVYGFRKARLVIWLGFLMNFIFVMFLQLCIVMPPDPSWTGQEAVDAVFGNTWRILTGSFIAFICGSMVNAYVMSRMKVKCEGRMFSLRAVVSTLFGESVDSVIFFPIAFLGILPISTILSLIWTQALLKTIYEVVALPVTIKCVRFIKRREETDTYDNNISYKWWRIDQF